MIPKIIKYGGTNSIAFAFDFILLLTLDYLFDLNRSILAGFCYLSGTIVSYLLAKNFVFNAGWLDNKPAIEFSAYFLGGVLGSLITSLIFAISFAYGVENIVIQKFIATFFSFFTIYAYRKYLVFKND